jgi:hypothetical protein
VFNENNQRIANGKGQVVNLVHKEDICERIDAHWLIRWNINAFERAVDLTNTVFIAEKRGEEAGFIVAVHIHKRSVTRTGTKGKQRLPLLFLLFLCVYNTISTLYFILPRVFFSP